MPTGNWSGAHAVGWDRNAPEFGDLSVGDNFQKHSYPLGIMIKHALGANAACAEGSRLSLEAQISAPNFRHGAERRRISLGKQTALGDDIGIIAYRKSQVNILLDQKDSQTRVL